MSGNSNSGRRGVYEEYNKSNAINKLWEKVNRKVMAGEDLSEYEEKLVIALLPKTIKTDVGLGGLDGNDLPPLMVKFIKE